MKLSALILPLFTWSTSAHTPKPFVLLCLLAPALLPAQDFAYTITDNATVTITRYTGPGGNVIVPGSIDGLPVTAIGSNAFSFCYGVSSVSLPETVTHIQDGLDLGVGTQGAFMFCSLTNITLGNSLTNVGDFAFFLSGLTSITIPGSVARIGSDAFSRCTSLTNVVIANGPLNIGADAFAGCGLAAVTIPRSVTNIGARAFCGCPNASAIAVDPLNTFYASVDGVLFDSAQATLLAYPSAKAGHYAIPESVTSIADSAFAGSSRLTSITLATQITNIADSAFISCTGLTNISIDHALTTIGGQAFRYCSSLRRVTIPAAVIRLGDWAFRECDNLEEVYFAGNAPAFVGEDPFYVDQRCTIYYLPGTTGWTATFAGRPTALWNPWVNTGDTSFGVRNNRFGFNIVGTADIPLVIEASTSLAPSPSVRLQSCTLTNGLLYFSDPEWGIYSNRFYRIRSP